MERPEYESQLTEEQSLLLSTVREFARDSVAPAHEHLDHEDVHPDSLVESLGGLGLFGVAVPAERGGAGMGVLAEALAIMELAAAAGAVGAIAAAHGIGMAALAGAGGDSDLGDHASGAVLVAPAFCEADPGALATIATPTGKSFRVSGEKTGVAFPKRAGIAVVLAREGADGSAGLFAVDSRATGATHATRDRRTNLLGFETGTLSLDHAAAKRLGGADLVAATISRSRIIMAAWFCGLGRGVLAHAVRYGGERRQFDREIIDFTAMQERIGGSAARVAAATALTLGVARLADAPAPYAVAAARARHTAAEAALSAADDALQVFGGYGYSREYPAERFYRDAAFAGFGEGGTARLLAEITADLR